jgi:hypothetical protein
MTTRLIPVALLVASACALAACGGSGDGGSRSSDSQPILSAAEFPAPKGKSMQELRHGLGPGPVLAPTVQEIVPGKERYGFALFTTGRKQISDIPVALYLERSGSAKVTGPFVARDTQLKVAPPYQSETVAKDPDAAKSLYVSHIPFPKSGNYAVMAVAKLDGRLVATDPIGARVLASDPVPNVGDKAPVVDTPTVKSAGGNVASIDTRQPPDDMHADDLKDVIGKKPVVLVFATPALCQSRVCGPVVDIAEEVKAESKSDTAFIHMEIYRDNEFNKGFRPQVQAYGLRTEPWVFAIDRRGRVAARIEGAFSARELERAVDAAQR